MLLLSLVMAIILDKKNERDRMRFATKIEYLAFLCNHTNHPNSFNKTVHARVMEPKSMRGIWTIEQNIKAHSICYYSIVLIGLILDIFLLYSDSIQ
jgi:hypothetical protein